MDRPWLIVLLLAHQDSRVGLVNMHLSELQESRALWTIFGAVIVMYGLR